MAELDLEELKNEPLFPKTMSHHFKHLTGNCLKEVSQENVEKIRALYDNYQRGLRQNSGSDKEIKVAARKMTIESLQEIINLISDEKVLKDLNVLLQAHESLDENSMPIRKSPKNPSKDPPKVSPEGTHNEELSELIDLGDRDLFTTAEEEPFKSFKTKELSIFPDNPEGMDLSELQQCIDDLKSAKNQVNNFSTVYSHYLADFNKSRIPENKIKFLNVAQQSLTNIVTMVKDGPNKDGIQNLINGINEKLNILKKGEGKMATLEETKKLFEDTLSIGSGIDGYALTVDFKDLITHKIKNDFVTGFDETCYEPIKQERENIEAKWNKILSDYEACVTDFATLTEEDYKKQNKSQRKVHDGNIKKARKMLDALQKEKIFKKSTSLQEKISEVLTKIGEKEKAFEAAAKEAPEEETPKKTHGKVKEHAEETKISFEFAGQKYEISSNLIKGFTKANKSKAEQKVEIVTQICRSLESHSKQLTDQKLLTGSIDAATLKRAEVSTYKENSSTLKDINTALDSLWTHIDKDNLISLKGMQQHCQDNTKKLDDFIKANDKSVKKENKASAKEEKKHPSVNNNYSNYATVDSDYEYEVQTGNKLTFAENKLTIPQLNRAIEKCNELISKYEKLGDNRSVARFVTMKKRYINARGKILTYYNRAIVKNPALATRKNYLTVAMIKGGKTGNGWSFLPHTVGIGFGHAVDFLSDHRGAILATGITATSGLLMAQLLTKVEVSKDVSLGKFLADKIKGYLTKNPLVSAAVFSAAVTTILAAVPAIKDAATRRSNHKLERKHDLNDMAESTIADMNTEQNEAIGAVQKSSVASLKDESLIEEIAQSPAAMKWLKNAISQHPSKSTFNLTERQRSYASALLAKAEQKKLQDIKTMQQQQQKSQGKVNDLASGLSSGNEMGPHQPF